MSFANIPMRGRCSREDTAVHVSLSQPTMSKSLQSIAISRSTLRSSTEEEERVPFASEEAFGARSHTVDDLSRQKRRSVASKFCFQRTGVSAVGLRRSVTAVALWRRLIWAPAFPVKPLFRILFAFFCRNRISPGDTHYMETADFFSSAPCCVPPSTNARCVAAFRFPPLGIKSLADRKVAPPHFRRIPAADAPYSLSGNPPPGGKSNPLESMTEFRHRLPAMV